MGIVRNNVLCAVASIKRDQRYGETDAQLDVPGVLRFLNRRHRTGEDPDDGNVIVIASAAVEAFLPPQTGWVLK